MECAMTTTSERDRILPLELTQAEAEMARTAQRVIMESLDHSRAASVTVFSEDGSAPSVAVPPQALRFIGQVLGLMSQRQPIVLMPARQEMSTVEVANFLNVSRPFVIKEIEAGRLPHRMVGSHRRVLYEDLLIYAKEMRAGQQAALDRMADHARALGLDY
jgi:excisionase family DNA binding protein